VKPLYITTSLHFVARHKHMPKIPLDQGRAIIRDLARAKHRTLRERRLVVNLEHATGMPITDLAALTAQWVPHEKPAAASRHR
jgi:hypothetical protein